RQAAAKKLAGEIERRTRRLDRLSSKVERALAPAPAAGGRGSGGIEVRVGERVEVRIGERIAGLAKEFSELNEGNLHAFRKRIKTVRYLAEAVGRADADAARRAATLKRMTAAAGEWHDWQALAAEAGCGGDDAAALVRILEVQAARKLEQALALCRRSIARLQGARLQRARLLKEAANGNAASGKDSREGLSGSSAERIPRKPVVSAEADFHGAVTERALLVS
ncbi:MAG: CHAD domain-containing protein, partial [Terracidiphilus sp.]